MRVIVVGLGVQGNKRRHAAGADYVASVDPVNADADYRTSETCRSRATTRLLACIPDEPKVDAAATTAATTASTSWSRSRCGRNTMPTSPSWSDSRAATMRRDLHRLQPPLRAALRAHARPDRFGISSGRSMLPHVLRQRHGAAGARIRPGATRAPACCPISARICSTPAGSGSATCRIRFRGHRRAIASRTARPITWSSAREEHAPRIELEMTLLHVAQPFHLRHPGREGHARTSQVAVQMGAVDVHPAHARAAERPAAGRRA